MQPTPQLERRVGLLVAGIAVLFAAGIGYRAFTTVADPTTTTLAGGTPSGTTSTVDSGGSTTTDTVAEGESTTSTSLAPLVSASLQPIATGLGQPTYATAPPGEDRIWVAERPGRIRIVEADGSIAAQPFLDIQDQVSFDGIEQGMLGFAFHPDFPDVGRVFVYYVGPGAARRLSEFAVTGDSADPASERILLEAAQPPRSTDIRHYGGMLQFGPDRYLWVSSGDGANASDQGQNPDGLFGKILRLDVESGDPYGIPADNPFVDEGGGREVWAYGLRNPWRFSIDFVESNIYIGDVGFGVREEINVLSLATGGGSNLGWAHVEGTECFQLNPCDPGDYVLPALEYDHEDGNCSVTGGLVYRGEAIPELDGAYFYSDWCAGWIRSFTWNGTAVTDERDWTDELGSPGQVNAFGVDGAGEILVVTHGGDVSRLVANR